MTEKSSTITNAVCKKLVEISASHEENADFEKALASVSILDKIKKIDTSAPLLDTKKDGLSIITLTGWVALASVAALVLVIGGGAYYAYRKFTGTDQPYTLVIKGGDR